MKKMTALLLALVLILGLAACGGSQETVEVSATPTPEPTPDTAAIMAASQSDAQAAAQSLPPASSTDALVDQEAYETAQQYIGLTVEELYAAIGEPSDVQYAASCEEEGAEDGMLFYDGFYIWSVRTEEEEIVRAVYMNVSEEEEVDAEAADGEAVDGDVTDGEDEAV